MSLSINVAEHQCCWERKQPPRSADGDRAADAYQKDESDYFFLAFFFLASKLP